MTLLHDRMNPRITSALRRIRRQPPTGSLPLFRSFSRRSLFKHRLNHHSWSRGWNTSRGRSRAPLISTQRAWNGRKSERYLNGVWPRTRSSQSVVVSLLLRFGVGPHSSGITISYRLSSVRPHSILLHPNCRIAGQDDNTRAPEMPYLYSRMCHMSRIDPTWQGPPNSRSASDTLTGDRVPDLY